MSTELRFPLHTAERVAAELVTMLSPVCSRIAIAGSIRRRRPSVGDIELLVIPKPPADDIFKQDPLDMKIRGELVQQGVLVGRRNAKGAFTYGPLNKLMVHVSSGIPVDIFTATHENWGRDLMVRTGSKAWNVKVMSRFIDLRLRGHAYGPYAVTGRGQRWTAPDEEELFRLLQWGYVPPERRG